MARPFEKIADINETKELRKVAVKIHHKWTLSWCVTIETTKKLKATGNGWYYLACCKCPRVAKGASPSYTCSDGNSSETKIYRYKIEVEIVDNGISSIFVFWDHECNELLEIYASQLRKTMLQDGISNPLEFSLVLDNLIGHGFAFKVKWQPRWKNASVMMVVHDKETIHKLLAQWEVCKPTTNEVKLFDDQLNQIRESVDETMLAEEWNIINDLEITSKLNSQLLPSDLFAIMNYTTLEKAKAKTSPPVTPINEIVRSTTAPPITPINSRKRLAVHASSYSATLKE
ncbi:uncharacterized protein LOC127130595 [Lathyrus oleraceus]|uniref:uncharacterized protein LOC127130595 n=1 Tax=Pisum sativum TaxID=3888 RepID=UPI0021D0D098|nr:uncharacterized protein LOC127130595 [Pisum sativum]